MIAELWEKEAENMLDPNTSLASPQSCGLASQFLRGTGKVYIAVL